MHYSYIVNYSQLYVAIKNTALASRLFSDIFSPLLFFLHYHITYGCVLDCVNELS